MEHIIIIGHGSPKESANNMEVTARLLHPLVHPKCQADCVKVAYLQFAKPDIAQAIETSVAEGVTRIILHPLFLTAGIHVTRDIPDLLAYARSRHPGVEFLYTEPLGVHQKIIEVIAERIRAARGRTAREIEEQSFDLIFAEEDLKGIPEEHLPVITRVIHATGDFEFKKTLLFHPEAVKRGIAAIRAGQDIATDVEMVRAGINKKLLAPWGGRVICHLPDEAAFPAPQAGDTRAARGMIEALKDGHNLGILVVGNAPTALLKAIELISGNQAAPPLVIGVPVGFVQALEAKALLARQPFPFITNLSRKGGSAVAVAIVNALLKMANA